jgi:PAS domain S-box-containing protein
MLPGLPDLALAGPFDLVRRTNMPRNVLTYQDRRGPAFEAKRLAALDGYEILDTPRERDFDDVAEMAAAICETPIAVINLISADRQFFKAEVGLGVRETPLDSSFCAKAILEEDFLVVPDATKDARFNCNPLVTGAPHLRFYAGALLKTAEGLPIGTVCVLDYKPRDLSPVQAKSLRVLARQVMNQLDLRRSLLARNREIERQGKAQAVDDIRYRMLVEGITDYAIYLLDLSGQISSWNAGARRFKGYEAAEIIGQNFSTFYTPDDRIAGLPERALAHAARHGSFQAEGWRLRKDGTRFWASVVIDAIRDPNGDVIGFAKITRDLTERREAERALRASEEQFRLLVQGVTDYAIYMLDPGGRVISWNLGAHRIKGYSPEEIIGQHFSKFYTEEDRERGAPAIALETALRVGRFEKEGLRVRKDGTVFLAHVIIDTVRDQDGTLIGFAKITRDVTERAQAQRELDKAKEALFQSQKMDAIGQLTGGVAHDFNNLLMVIMGSIELAAKRAGSDARLARFLDNAMQGAKRGAVLTQRLLAFARRQELALRPVDIAKLVLATRDLLDSAVGAGVEIEMRLPADLPLANVDPNQLELAVLNLVTNARDAMEGVGRIIIAARDEVVGEPNAHGVRTGHYICLSVTDDGIGMDEVTLAKAAEPFFTTKGVGMGTGLGLPMVHGMAIQIGGGFSLRSEPGKGTTAEMFLPLAKIGEVEVTSTILVPSGGVRPLTVLAVDDDGLVLLNTVAMLEDMGHTVLEAHSGEEALSVSRAHAVDLVITDQSMPKMTGTRLAEIIQAEKPGLPVIVATGYAELPPGTSRDLPILPKPFTSDALALAVATIMAAERWGA